MSENETVIEENKIVEEQIPEKTDDEIYTEMFKFAKENKYETKVVFDWVLTNLKTDARKMSFWGMYVAELTRYNTTVQVKGEDQLKLLKILE